MIKGAFRNNIISLYIEWQFFDVPKGILKAWRNFLKFNLNYFSIPLLLKTFFSPWHRYRMSYGKKFAPWHYFEAFVFNSMSRIIGAFLRLFFILLGIFFEALIFFTGLIILLGWFLLPIIFIIGFLFGFSLLL